MLVTAAGRPEDDGGVVAALLAAGAAVDEPDESGMTPLMAAAGMGNIECVQVGVCSRRVACAIVAHNSITTGRMVNSK